MKRNGGHRSPTEKTPMKIFVINMARATERRATILRHLDELGLEAEFVDVDNPV